MAQVNFEFKDLPKLKQHFDPKKLRKAVRSTFVQTGNRVKTHVSKQVRTIYNIKAGDIRSSVGRVQMPTPESAFLLYQGPGLSMRRFGVRKRMVNGYPGVSVAIKKGNRKIVKGGFQPAQDLKRPIFRRKGKSRLPIEKLTTVSIPQMVGNKEIEDSVGRFVETEFPKQFNRAMNYYMNVKR